MQEGRDIMKRKINLIIIMLVFMVMISVLANWNAEVTGMDTETIPLNELPNNGVVGKNILYDQSAQAAVATILDDLMNIKVTQIGTGSKPSQNIKSKIKEVDAILTLLIKEAKDNSVEFTDEQKNKIRIIISTITSSIDKTTPLSNLYKLQSAYKEYDTSITQKIEERHEELVKYGNNPSLMSNLENQEKDQIIADSNSWLADAEARKKAGETPDFDFELAKKIIRQFEQERWDSRTFYERMDTIYEGATAGRYLADKLGINGFEWSERFFQGSFGQFITGEPPAGICDKTIKKAGSSQGIIVDSSLLGNLVAHIEGEKTKIINPEGNIEYLYKITLQIKPKKETDRVTYNIDLFSSNALQVAIFKQDQSKQGAVNHVGETAFIQYSTKNYDKLCLRSSVGNTCNRFADITEFAEVITTPNSGSNSGSSQSNADSSATNAW